MCQEGRRKAEREIRHFNYHVYQDSTGLLYDIKLIRPWRNPDDRGIMDNELFELRLYESDLPPKMYATIAVHFGKAPAEAEAQSIVSMHRQMFELCRAASQFGDAFKAWRDFFMFQTGVNWDFRVWNIIEPRTELLSNLRPEILATYMGEHEVFFSWSMRWGLEPPGDMGLFAQGVERYNSLPPCLPRSIGGGKTGYNLIEEEIAAKREEREARKKKYIKIADRT